MSCKRWPDGYIEDKYRDGHPAPQCGSSGWRGTPSSVESRNRFDTGPRSGRPARGGCRPPPRRVASRILLTVILAPARKRLRPQVIMEIAGIELTHGIRKKA